jgi:hypothetical protein
MHRPHPAPSIADIGDAQRGQWTIPYSVGLGVCPDAPLVIIYVSLLEVPDRGVIVLATAGCFRASPQALYRFFPRFAICHFLLYLRRGICV